MFHKYLVEPMNFLIHSFAELTNGNFGLAIILLTLLIRLVLLPFMLKQYKTQQGFKEKMAVIKPEMDEIQKKLKATKDPAEQKKLQTEMMGIYRKHNVNPLASMGCLPLLIQMPILMGLYYAIRGSHEIASHNFLWFNLGSPDIIMTLLAGVIYFLQFKVSQLSMTPEQQKQMKFMGLISPIMIMFVSFSAPAALPLYWSASGLFLMGQTFLGQRLYKSPNPEPTTTTTPIKEK
ncbi:membrane protein insertase YidC [Ferdinandcohnia quinoae]|uniref:Membrane protein insertase YidC n=1 Tax=Fredinandcohnia quinoae TaxID=2918902 RepID=A0AAW5DY91_9BACI|nr:membrane protein insertase YidC [Fredinandcohnia sp. SECRCQ15]MCH1625606.1 membrane protein insertase YidC [Fredinandcohnia sp. SECRCQ15]